MCSSDLTKNSSHRAADIIKISDIAKKVFGNDRVSSESHLESAIKAAIEAARFEYATNDRSCAVVITGSVVTAGEARSAIARMKGNLS